MYNIKIKDQSHTIIETCQECGHESAETISGIVYAEIGNIYNSYVSTAQNHGAAFLFPNARQPTTVKHMWLMMENMRDRCNFSEFNDPSFVEWLKTTYMYVIEQMSKTAPYAFIEVTIQSPVGLVR